MPTAGCVVLGVDGEHPRRPTRLARCRLHRTQPDRLHTMGTKKYPLSSFLSL
jgi:hypothetical protein